MGSSVYFFDTTGRPFGIEMEYYGEEYALDENIELEDEYFGYGEDVDMIHQQHPSLNHQQQAARQQQQQQATRQQQQQAARQQQQLSQEFQKQQQQLKDYYETKAAQEAKKMSGMESQLKEAMQRYSEAQAEIGRLKTRKTEEGGAREKIKQLEERVTLIKNKAKEKIEEKDAMIVELNGKIKNYEEMLAMLEVNCKEAVVKFNGFQQELVKKEEIIQNHVSFKNRYDYTINYLTEKCQFITDNYEKKLKALEEKLKASRPPNPPTSGDLGPDLPVPEAPASDNTSLPPDGNPSDLAKPSDCVNLIAEDETKSSDEANKVTLGEAVDELVQMDE